ncbi:MAG: hypothetical protein ACRDCE_20265 [Cetobacterium sp.]|uniref:hypothetical protein n=1 Tax=Cetobacterium sp. TaxID=2071632 RepID=UPI003EE6D18F
MAAQEKKMFVTAIGTVGQYPYLQKPDYGTDEFPKPRGEWSCKLVIPSAKAQKMINMLEQTQEAHYANYVKNVLPKQIADAKAKGKKPPKKLESRDLPFYEDDNGNVVFQFKGHASWEKDGETKEIILRVYDSAGKRISEVPNIGMGSEGRVEFSIVPYVSAVAGVGLKLQLSKFMLLKLKEWTAGGDDTFGHDMDEEYEGGFMAPKPDTFGGASSMDSEDDSNDSEDDTHNYDF